MRIGFVLRKPPIKLCLWAPVSGGKSAGEMLSQASIIRLIFSTTGSSMTWSRNVLLMGSHLELGVK
jgi:hypothetical protein